MKSFIIPAASLSALDASAGELRLVRLERWVQHELVELPRRLVSRPVMKFGEIGSFSGASQQHNLTEAQDR